jgi:Amt family ammonium transporter
MEQVSHASNVVFVLLGAIMVLAMHAGFAFLEVGTVRKKNQVNALVKILTDFCVSAIAYFFIGYTIAYGAHFFASAEVLSQKSGYEMVKFFFLLTFAAAIPAIISGGIAERAKFHPRASPPSCWWALSIPSSRASPGTTTSACSPGWSHLRRQVP